MKKIVFTLLMALVAFIADAQIQNLQKLGQLSFPTTCAGVWHYADGAGNEYALIGNGDGTVIVDVTVPTNPVVLFTVPGATSLWREIKVYGNYAYSGTEGGGGITIIDLSNLPASYTSKIYDGDGAIAGQLSSSHTVQVFGEYLYIFGSNIGVGGAVICDLADPWNPTYVGLYDDNYIHDGYVLNDTLYGAEIYAGQFSVVDVTDKSNPVLFATQPTPGAFNHNTWFSDNLQYLYTTDELPNTPVGVFDVSDITNIELVATYYNDSLPNEEVHNVRVFNDYVIAPSYGSQLVIIDGARPENLIEIARYGTGGYLCWDASPYLPSGNIIASDMDGEFYVFAPYYVRACYLEGNVTDLNTGLAIDGAQVKIMATTAQTASKLNGDYKTGYPTPGTFDVEFSKNGYITKVINGVVLSSGILTTLDVQLESFSAIGQVIDAVTSLPVPFAKVRALNATNDITITADAAGEFTLNTISPGTYEFTAALWGYRSGCITANVGTPGTVIIPITPGIYDDFTFDFGWTVSGNATGGIWAWGEPVGTVFTTTQANPDVDASTDCANRAFVTGNAGGSVNNDDVDDGTTILTSPVFDLTSYTNPYLNYERWFFEQFSANPAANDTMFISIYNGNATEVVELVTGPSSTNSSWVPVSKRILDFLSLSSTMQVSIAISDKFGSGNPLEGAFDHFSISEGPLSVSEVNSGSNFVIAPNPVTDKFEIYFNSGNSFEYEQVVISDVTGREIFKAAVNGTEQMVISTAEWNKGVYFVTMLTKTGAVSSSKLVKY